MPKSHHQDENFLKLENLTAVRGYALLFSNLNFKLDAGRFAALKGPNGSGKTTLLRMVAGFIEPETGSMTRPSEEKDRGPFYLGHDHGLRATETAISHLRYWARLHSVPMDTIPDIIERLGLKSRALVPAHSLSAGQKKRLGLARALLTPRKLWLLDEPAAALDTKGQALLCDVIREHLAAGGLCLAALHDPLALEPDDYLDVSEFRQ